MKVNVQKLTGKALDWAVTACEGYDSEVDGPVWGMWKWATDWGQGGPLIERERICLEFSEFGSEHDWVAYCGNKQPDALSGGSTALEAAMRCFVALTFGDEIEVPNALLEGGEA